MARRLRIGWPHQYRAIMTNGSYAVAGVDATLTYTPAADTTPNQFTFVDQTGAAVSTVVTSAAITIGGLSTGTTITLNASGGTIDKNGDGNFLGSQLVTNGDTVRARLTTSANSGTATNCTVAASPSGVQDVFTVTTAVAAGGIDFFIGPNGSDSNPGTQAQPWAITALNTKRAQYAGHTVGFLDGYYDVSAANQPTRGFAVPLYNCAGGTASSPTVIKSVNPRGAWIQAKTPGGVYTGSKSGNIYNGFHQPHEGGVFANTTGVTAGNITFDGFKMSGEQTVLIRIGEGPLGSGNVYGYANVSIINCELFDCNDAQAGNGTADGANVCPIQTFNTDNLLIENNYIHDIISWSTNTADHLSALIPWFSRNTTIRYNTLVQAGAIYGKEYPQPGLVCEYNYVQETRNTVGIFDWVGAVNQIAATGLITHIRYNVINVSGGGIAMTETLGTGNQKTPFKDPIYIYNNTVYCVSPGNNPHIGYSVNTNIAGQSRCYNNIMFGGMNIFERKMHSFNPRAPGLTDYNWFPASGTRWRLLSDSTYGPDSGTAYSTIATLAAAVQAAGGISSSLVEAHSVQSSQTAAQMFTLSGTFASQFQLAASSSAKNAGSSDGTTSGGTVDMGAWTTGVTRIGCDFA